MATGELYVEVGYEGMDVIIAFHLETEGRCEGEILHLHCVDVHLLQVGGRRDQKEEKGRELSTESQHQTNTTNSRAIILQFLPSLPDIYNSRTACQDCSLLFVQSTSRLAPLKIDMHNLDHCKQ